MPEPYIAHVLPATAGFRGRAYEREALSKWLRTKSSPSVRVLTGTGGIGKSSLARVWLERDVLRRDLPGVGEDEPEVRRRSRLAPRFRPEGVMWWSFDRPGAGFSVFLDEAIAYLTSGAVDTGSYLASRSEKVKSLISLLRDGNFLIVLDGFERELRAFATLDAAYQGDAYVEGRQREHRICADLHAADFLRCLGAETLGSRILITSRLVPGELGDPSDPGAECLELGGLEPSVAVAMLQACGVEGDAAEIEMAAAGYGYHPLSLRLLAGLLTNGRGRGAALETECLPGPHDRDAVVNASIAAIDDQRRAWLGYLAAFRGLITPEQAAMCDPFGGSVPLSDLIEELVRRGLVMRDEGSGLLQLHTVVRRAAWEALPNRHAAHNHLAEFFGQVELPPQIRRVDELLPAIEHYHHLIGAGRYQEAFVLLSGQLMRALRDRFNDRQMLMQLLRALFRGKEPLLEDSMDRAWTLDCLAKACSYSGETRRAMTMLVANLPSFKCRGAEESLTMLLGTLAGVQTRLGHLRAAEETLRRLVQLTGELGCRPEQAVARNRLGLLLATRGAFDEAMAEFDASFQIVKEIGDQQIQSVSFSYYTERALLMGDPSAALDAAQKTRAFVEQASRRGESAEDDYVRSGGLLGAAYVAVAERGGEGSEAHLGEAERYLTDALSRCRRNDLVGFEPDLLLTMARWHRLCGRADDARHVADEALALADRCEYRPKKAKIHAFRARLLLDEGDSISARTEAEIARDCAECDGEPSWCRGVLDEVEGLLTDIDGRPERRADAENEAAAGGKGDAKAKPAASKAPVRKPSTRKPSTRKATTRKRSTRKPTTKKPTTKKPTTRKPAVRQAKRKAA
jgi:tetratricopeptide (TPR) repeat protein